MPERLPLDEARPLKSEEQKRVLEQCGVQPVVAPGEACFRFGVVERCHHVFRAAVATYVEQEKLPLTLESVREAVFQVSPAMSQLSSTNGYTPAQWV